MKQINLNLEGKRFGKLEVLKRIQRTDIKNPYIPLWECKCDCGKIREVRQYNLLNGTKSCGSYTCRYGEIKPAIKSGHESPYFKGCGELSLTLYNKYKRRATRYKIKEFSISIEYLWELFLKQNRKCSLTGELIEFGSQKRNRPTASLDRIDSTKGYIEGNVQWVHKMVNKMKMEIPQDKFIEWCKKITLYNQRLTNENCVISL